MKRLPSEHAASLAHAHSDPINRYVPVACYTLAFLLGLAAVILPYWGRQEVADGVFHGDTAAKAVVWDGLFEICVKYEKITVSSSGVCFANANNGAVELTQYSAQTDCTTAGGHWVEGLTLGTGSVNAEDVTTLVHSPNPDTMDHPEKECQTRHGHCNHPEGHLMHAICDEYEAIHAVVVLAILAVVCSFFASCVALYAGANAKPSDSAARSIEGMLAIGHSFFSAIALIVYHVKSDETAGVCTGIFMVNIFITAVGGSISLTHRLPKLSNGPARSKVVAASPHVMMVSNAGESKGTTAESKGSNAVESKESKVSTSVPVDDMDEFAGIEDDDDDEGNDL